MLELPSLTGSFSINVGSSADEPWDGETENPSLFSLLKAIVIASQATAANTEGGGD